MDPDPAIRRILERHLDDLVRPAVLHEKVRARVYRQLRRELGDLGHGWWRRWRAVAAVKREVRRIRKEPPEVLTNLLDPLDGVELVAKLLFEILCAAL